MNASIMEIIQTIAALLGGLMTVRAKINADRNLTAVMLSTFNGMRRVIAQKNVRIENCILGVQTLLCTAGLTTMFLAPPPMYIAPDEIHAELLKQTLQTMQIRAWTMTAVSVILLFLSYRNWITLVPLHATRRADDDPRTSPVERVAIKTEVVAGAAQAVADTARVVADEAKEIIDHSTTPPLA